MASVGRKKDTCWKPKIQILAAKKSGSGEFFFVPTKVFRVTDRFVY